jgi:acetyl esterase/lipase
MTRKNISYANRSKTRNQLDVIYDAAKTHCPVIFFIHGGSWMTGSKDMYTRLGTNFLEKGFVSVIINYRLFPSTDIYGMVEDCRDAFNWCKEHVNEFGGDPKKIFLTGHSAGGHLCAVTGLMEDPSQATVKGFVLIDAFGLCANYFLTEHGSMVPEFFSGIFGRQKERWPGASPDNLLKAGAPSFLVLTGGNTYPFVNFDNSNFVSHLNRLGISGEHKVIDSLSHMQMIYEFENTKTELFKTTHEWISSLLSKDKPG